MITLQMLIDIEQELSKYAQYKREIWLGPINDYSKDYSRDNSKDYDEYSRVRAIHESLRKEIGVVTKSVSIVIEQNHSMEINE